MSPDFHTVSVTTSRVCLPLKTNFVVVSNRGDETASHIGDVELSFENSDDTFLLLHGERERFWGDFTHICYIRKDDGHTDKIRLDIFEA